MVGISQVAHSGRARRGWTRWVFGGLFILIVLGLFVVPLFFAGWFAFYGPGPWFVRPFFFFPFGFFFFILLAFFAFRVLFWGWGGRWRRSYYYHGGWGQPQGNPLEILNQRYARGEITKEQYDQMKRDIQSQP